MRSRFAMRWTVLVAACVAMSALSNSAHGAWFSGLGGLSGAYSTSAGFDISANGSTVVGSSASDLGWEAFRWTRSEGMVGLGDLPGGYFSSEAHGVSADGSVVIGLANSANGPEAFRWTSDGGIVGLGDLPGGYFSSNANSVSADGSVVVGESNSGSGGIAPDGQPGSEAFRWTSESGMMGLGQLSGGSYSEALAVSADGSIIVGMSDSAPANDAFRWTDGEGMVGLGYLSDGGTSNSALGISADDSVVVGAAGDEAFRWTSNDGMVGLGFLPGGTRSGARDASSDGNLIVGECDSALWDPDGEAFIWTSTDGMRKLRDVLNNVLPPPDAATLRGWILQEAEAVSDDGLTVAGWGRNASGNTEAWVAYLGTEVPEPASWVLIAFSLSVALAAQRAPRVD